MYRAATVSVLDAGVVPKDSGAVVEVVAQMRLEVSTDPNDPATILNGRRIDAEIRSAAVTSAVSAVSAIPEVRTQLVAQQRQIIAAAPTVAEGRDIGSVVWPTAELKVYLTADEQVRAARRAGELGTDVGTVTADLARRDKFDSSRVVSPLRRSDDAVVVDTTFLSVDQVVDVLTDLALRRVSAIGGA
jgi:cytidylate kinase